MRKDDFPAAATAGSDILLQNIISVLAFALHDQSKVDYCPRCWLYANIFTSLSSR